MIIDAHADIGAFVGEQKRKGRSGVIETDLLPDLKAGKLDVVVCACYLEGDALRDAKALALEQMRLIREEAERLPALALVRNKAELELAHARGKLSLMLSLEGAEPLETVDDLEQFYNEGLRFVGMVWSRENRYAYGCAKQFEDKPGLKTAGFELLEAMHAKHMIVDISHLNDPGMFDVLNYYKGLPIASHSNARSLTLSPRNMTDAQLKLLAERGGVVGLNAVRSFLNSDRDAASQADMYRHLEHLVNVAGEDHVGLGFDLCDQLVPVEGWQINTMQHFSEVFPFVESMPFPERIKDKITHQNWLRIYETL